MAYLAPAEFVGKMVDAGESKLLMSTRDTLIRAYMAGAILALSAVFAVTINVNTGNPLIGALLFPVGFWLRITGPAGRIGAMKGEGEAGAE